MDVHVTNPRICFAFASLQDQNVRRFGTHTKKKMETCHFFGSFDNLLTWTGGYTPVISFPPTEPDRSGSST